MYLRAYKWKVSDHDWCTLVTYLSILDNKGHPDLGFPLLNRSLQIFWANFKWGENLAIQVMQTTMIATFIRSYYRWIISSTQNTQSASKTPLIETKFLEARHWIDELSAHLRLVVFTQ